MYLCANFIQTFRFQWKRKWIYMYRMTIAFLILLYLVLFHEIQAINASYTILSQSQLCNPLYSQVFAWEYLALMHKYESNIKHNQYVSRYLSHNVHTSLSIKIIDRTSPSTRNTIHDMDNIPTDFVAIQLYLCSIKRQHKLHPVCHISENQILSFTSTIGSHDIKRFHRNRSYLSTSLHQFNSVNKTTQNSLKKPLLVDDLGIRSLWNDGFKGQGVKIGVFDTGITLTRASQLQMNVKERINWTNEKRNTDNSGHGTVIASIINHGDHHTCPGIAPDAELYVFRMFTSEEQLSFTSWFLDAFNYALYKKINIINLSTGGPDFRDRPFIDKITELTANGIIIVSAVGNNGPKYGTLTNPADQIEVIAVGGLSEDGENVAEFSSRGMTTWELPFGYGRVKPDIITKAVDIQGLGISNNADSQCVPLSGTSVAAPIITGVIAILASMVPEVMKSEHRTTSRWNLINSASVKQILIKTADRLRSKYNKSNFSVSNHIYEQGGGVLNVTRAALAIKKLIHDAQSTTNEEDIILPPSSIPKAINTSDCPYLWPFCMQKIYTGALPLILNLTILHPSNVYGQVIGNDHQNVILDNHFTDARPVYSPDNFHDGKYLNVSIALSPKGIIYPYVGYVGVFIRATPEAINFAGSISGKLTLTIQSGANKEGSSVAQLVIPIQVDIIPPPPRNRKLLWDQFHSIRYPSAFVLRDSIFPELEPGISNGVLSLKPSGIPRLNAMDSIDSAGDHIHTNFHQLWNFLNQVGYFIEILTFEYTCVSLEAYSVLLIVDPEEEFLATEVHAIENALKYEHLSLLLFADWYDPSVLSDMTLFDTATLSEWQPVMAGANIPAINTLLKPFHIEFGIGVRSNDSLHITPFTTQNTNVDELNLGSPDFPYASGSFITRFPVGGFLGVIDAVDDIMLQNKSFESSYYTNVPVLGLYEIPSRRGGRIAVFGDSACIDSSVHPTEYDLPFRHCFSLVKSLLDFLDKGRALLPQKSRDNLTPSSDADLFFNLRELKTEFKYSPSEDYENFIISSEEIAQQTQLLEKYSNVLQANKNQPMVGTFCDVYQLISCHETNSNRIPVSVS